VIKTDKLFTDHQAEIESANSNWPAVLQHKDEEEYIKQATMVMLNSQRHETRRLGKHVDNKYKRLQTISIIAILKTFSEYLLTRKH